MQEALLHYVWKNACLESSYYTTDTDEQVTLIKQGIHNTDAGPDFTEAKITLDDTIWVGNIEIHLQASDWYAHKHHENPAYNNVILHVVLKNNKACFDTTGRQIPCIEISIKHELELSYLELYTSQGEIPCAPKLSQIDPIRFEFWFSALAIDRLSTKTDAIINLLALTNNNWEESFFIQIARGFGLKINSLAFELLAKSFPLKILKQEPNNIFRTEALLFGQAGFLNEETNDAYQNKLKEEYTYLQNKYDLVPLDQHIWKFLRLRPLNFPTIRIAQFASLLSGKQNMFSTVMDLQKREDFVNYFSCDVSAYWKNHYTFGNTSVFREKKLGKNSVYLIIINVVVPFMFSFGQAKNKSNLKEHAIRLLEYLPAEKNNVLNKWMTAGIHCSHAANSQALIELHNNYCSNKRCLDCQIGHLLINQ